VVVALVLKAVDRRLGYGLELPNQQTPPESELPDQAEQCG
jgi:hypothetical protein